MAEKLSMRLERLIDNLPFVTLGIIALNIIVYAASCDHLKTVVEDYGLVVRCFRIGSLLTASFVHASFLAHLVPNMLLLYLIGRRVERAMGRLEYLIFYLGACFAASILHTAMVLAALLPYYESVPVVGASGAIAGVMGIYAVRFHRKIINFAGVEVSALFVIMCWTVMQIVCGVLGLYKVSLYGYRLDSVSWWSHLGGFAFGVVVALLSNMALNGEREYLISEAKRQYDEGNLLESAQNYETLLKYDPDNAFAYAELGRLWAILEEEEQSLPYYHCALEFYTNHGKEEEALAIAEEMKQFWPKATVSAATLFRLASYLEEAGQSEWAIAEFQQIAKGNPESAEAQMSLLKVGQLQLSSLHNTASAIATLKGFIERYPNSEWYKFAEAALNRAQDIVARESLVQRKSAV